ncbi:serine/threonine-protein kinase [Nonomuraea cavernae]|uniref:serine/threonine-protein kinase n=1 Tax=Nonomuraea cavernae TaxID=2045107 RepID=UPI0033D5E678
MGIYTLDARLGEGGQGIVYLARAADGSKVAVKLLRADLAGDAEASERFVREVELARRVAPFCTAQVVETGLTGGRPYIVSEYIDGPTLADVVRAEGPRSGTSLHRLAIGTVTALVAIHQAGIVHRDFKPSNVVLASDGPRVIDFGIARALDLTSTLTASVIGTPSFMAPEQLTESSPGPQSDMFAWACTLVFAASGQAPFGQDSLPAVINRILSIEPDVGSIADPALRSLVADCLAKDPARRPSAGDALMRLLGQVPGGASPGLLRQGSAVAASGPVPAAGQGFHAARPQPTHSMPQPQQPPARQQPAQQPPHPRPSGPQPFTRAPSGPLTPPHGPPPHGPPPRGRATGWIIAVSVAAAVALVVTATLVTVRLVALASAPPTSSPSPAPVSSPNESTSASSPTPSRSSAPLADGRTIVLPGSSVKVRENITDPIKLVSYSVNSGKQVYVRRAGSADFVRNTRYFEYALDLGGTSALATDVDYTADHYAQVSIVDHRTGGRRSVKLSKAPVFPTTPRWSPDGRLGLVTLYRATNGTSVEYGYAVIDVENGTGKIFKVARKGAGKWRFFWNGDSRTVGTWVGGRMTFYDLAGKQVRALGGTGSPVWVEGDDVSPSGTRFLAHCAAAGDTVCAYSTSGDVPAPIVVPFVTTRLIGWWDDEHLAVWRVKGGGYEAVVIDLKGRVQRVLATAAKRAEFDDMGFRYARGTS